jgi:hypothetical protein
MRGIEQVIALNRRQTSDIPQQEHWAIFEGTSISIPGDERSRTNPGHGYPAIVEPYLQYEAYLDKTEFEAELARRMSRGTFARPVRGARIIPVVATTTVAFDFAEKP